MTPGTRVQVTAGPHVGRDGTVVKHSHGVVEIESWCDREETFWALDQNVRALEDCPAEHVPATRKSIAAALRVVVVQLETLRGACVSVADHGAAREIFRAQQNLSAVAGRLGS